MISFIKGTLAIKTKEYIVIETNGIGYKIFMPASTISKLGDIGENLQVFTYMRVMQDDISLYGFITNEELRMFELLLSTSGIGAKVALCILSNVTPSQFALAVICDDVGVLKKIPGIGPKTAQRVIFELKDKLKKEQDITLEAGEEEQQVQESVLDDEKVQEAISALQVLGYTKKEVVEALKDIDMASLTVEDIIRKGLGNLARAI